MERLPYELQLLIFSKLPYEDRITSLHVSKAWNTAAKTCAFDDISITDQRPLMRAMTFFENNSNLTNQVINFKTDWCANIYRYLYRLQQLFPNLKELRADLPRVVSSFDTITLDTWKRLEIIETSEFFNEDTPPIVELILSGYCPNVSKVQAVFYSGNASDETAQGHCLRILKLLKNAPQLTTFDITFLHCEINELELLHQNTPKLDTLILSKHAELYLTDTPVKVLEFAHLSHLEINFFDWVVRERNEAVIALFDYIGKKYTGLTFFSVKCDLEDCEDKSVLSLTHESFNSHSIEQKLLPLFARCPGLTHYDQMFSPLSSRITLEMDRCGIQLKKTVLYFDEITIDSQLDALLGSQQRKYIEHLHLYKTDEFDNFIWPAPLFAQITNLKELRLTGNMDPICLTELVRVLKQLPRLEEFTISNTRAFDAEVDVNLPTLALKSLTIDSLEIDDTEELETVETVLPKVLVCCPKLQKVSIDLKLGKYCKPNPFTVSLDFRTQTTLRQICLSTHVIYLRSSLYCIKSPKMTRFFYEDDFGEALVEKEPFRRNEYYTTIILSHPTKLNGFTIG